MFCTGLIHVGHQHVVIFLKWVKQEMKYSLSSHVTHLCVFYERLTKTKFPTQNFNDRVRIQAYTAGVKQIPSIFEKQ